MRYRIRTPGKAEQEEQIQLHKSLFSEASLQSPADTHVWFVKASMHVLALILPYLMLSVMIWRSF